MGIQDKFIRYVMRRVRETGLPGAPWGDLFSIDNATDGMAPIYDAEPGYVWTTANGLYQWSGERRCYVEGLDPVQFLDCFSKALHLAELRRDYYLPAHAEYKAVAGFERWLPCGTQLVCRASGPVGVLNIGPIDTMVGFALDMRGLFLITGGS